jgi:hypothetical protein
MERRCHECTLCCKLLPIAELRKAANTRCQFQRANGCQLYHDARFPHSCRLWSCRWLVNDDADDLPRPDRAHYVIDPVPDYVELCMPDGSRQKLGVVQVWIDPKHPDAHRDPALRRWLERRARRTAEAALIRFDSSRALFLVPPCISPTGAWLEHTGGTVGPEHSAAEKLAAFGLPRLR